MAKIIGKRFLISGMTIEVVSDEGERWKTLNRTTNDTVYFKKIFLQNAIKLGKAEEIIQPVAEENS